MKLYILRHEDRLTDCTFFAPLSELGLSNSDKLVTYLNDAKIDIIFSSPFIRTLQTVYPFIKQSLIMNNVNIEYGLSEIHHPTIIPKKSYGIRLPEYLAKSFNYNCKYETIIKPTDIEYPETYNDVIRRTRKILRFILLQYNKSNINILLVTHQSLCTAILQIINEILPIKLNQHLITNYPMGKLSLIFDKNVVFKEIN